MGAKGFFSSSIIAINSPDYSDYERGANAGLKNLMLVKGSANQDQANGCPVWGGCAEENSSLRIAGMTINIDINQPNHAIRRVSTLKTSRKQIHSQLAKPKANAPAKECRRYRFMTLSLFLPQVHMDDKLFLVYALRPIIVAFLRS